MKAEDAPAKWHLLLYLGEISSAITFREESATESKVSPHSLYSSVDIEKYTAALVRKLYVEVM